MRAFGRAFEDAWPAILGGVERHFGTHPDPPIHVIRGRAISGASGPAGSAAAIDSWAVSWGDIRARGDRRRYGRRPQPRLLSRSTEIWYQPDRRGRTDFVLLVGNARVAG